jgi:hypothetical protein
LLEASASGGGRESSGVSGSGGTDDDETVSIQCLERSFNISQKKNLFHTCHVIIHLNIEKYTFIQTQQSRRMTTASSMTVASTTAAKTSMVGGSADVIGESGMLRC